MPAGPDAERRAALLGMKLGALVRERTEGLPIKPASFSPGAALVAGATAWLLADERPERAVGPALAWARQAGLDHVEILVDGEAAGTVARRAGWFTDPPGVWRVEGRALERAEPAPLPVATPVDPRLLEFVPLIEAAGAEPVVEHGVLAGEVAGLEVCRASMDPDLGVPRLEVGVGAHDREAFALVHGTVPTREALADVIDAVAVHRRPGGPPHPLRRLGAERRVRAGLIADPALVGCEVLAVAPPPVPRPNLKDPVPCVATGLDLEGRPVVVVCSVGIDLDLVPFAADARAAVEAAAPAPAPPRLLLAVPPRDDHPVTRALAARLRQPAEVVGVNAG